MGGYEERKEKVMKTAIVTGGTRGIGLAVSLALQEKGYLVYATYRKDEVSAKKAREQGMQVVKVDGTNEEEVNAFFASVHSVDLLVNNAGVALYRLIQDTTLAEWNEVFASNVTSTFLATKCAVKKMLGKGGCIVNISSVWGERGGSYESAYSASKAAIIGLTKALASEVGYSDIRVNAITPGCIETSMNHHLSDEEKVALTEEIPLGRFGTPEEVASAVLFLAENEYCNGTILSINGGF